MLQMMNPAQSSGSGYVPLFRFAQKSEPAAPPPEAVPGAVTPPPPVDGDGRGEGGGGGGGRGGG